MNPHGPAVGPGLPYGAAPGYGGGFTPPPPPPPPPSEPSSRAVVALVLAILGWVGCGCFLSLPAVFVAKAELDAIERHEAPPAGKGLATAAFWVAIVNVVLYVLIILLYVVLIGLGVVAGVFAGP